jgi:hypothetical protein
MSMNDTFIAVFLGQIECRTDHKRALGFIVKFPQFYSDRRARRDSNS